MYKYTGTWQKETEKHTVEGVKEEREGSRDKRRDIQEKCTERERKKAPPLKIYRQKTLPLKTQYRKVPSPLKNITYKQKKTTSTVEN